jgi:hypothetical protein
VRPTLVVLTFALLPAVPLQAQTPGPQDCGAEAPARVGLVVQYVKHLPDGHTERGPGTAVGQWGRTFIPDVSLGPQPHGQVVFEDPESSTSTSSPTTRRRCRSTPGRGSPSFSRCPPPS